MKRIFTLLFAFGLFTAASAQYNPGENRDSRQREPQANQRNDQRNDDNGYGNERDVVITNNPYDNNNGRYDNRISPDRKMAMQIARINREYDYRIQSVRNNFFMSRWEKQRQISFLQEQRQREIRMVYFRFHKNRDRYDDRYDRNNRYDQNDRSNGRY
jgi:hypothetical protein